MRNTSLATPSTILALVFVITVASLTTTTSAFAADAERGTPAVDDDLSLWDTARFGFGARIGGYMFREHAEDGGVAWDGCRMDGAGVFGTFELAEHWFTELSFDFYAANTAVVESHDMDRLSVMSLLAVGFRMFPDWYVSPNVHVGGGVEWTEFSFTDHSVDHSSVLGVGFIGIGVDGNIGDHFRLGASLRILAMGLPGHGHGGGHDQASVETQSPVALAAQLDGHGQALTEPTVEYQPAGQLLLFVRYRL